jgi:hypothetical protein
MDKNIFRPEQGGTVAISLKAPENGRVVVKIFAVDGTLVRPLFEADIQAGLWFQASWDGRNGDGEVIASGVYFVSVRGAGIRTIRRVVVIK